MNNITRLLTLFIFLFSFHAQADKIELVIQGKKQIVEFNPNDKADMDRAWKIWRTADNKKTYVYFETGTLRLYEEPRDDAKFIEIGTWCQELNTLSQQSPEFARLTWDKSKWHPRTSQREPGWIRLDDPNLIHPNQMKPVKEWPIRYYVSFKGTDTAASEEGLKPKYDEYSRTQFDREGYLLNNRTMERMKTSEGWLYRMFYYRDFVRLTAVLGNALDEPRTKEGGSGGFSLNLKQFLATPKVTYDEYSGFIRAWASFDDPVIPLIDKNNFNACAIDCKDKKRWEP